MRNKSVTVLDIRSSEICAAIAEKGVNNTFIIKSKYSQPYEGFAEGEILDADDFISAIQTALGNILSSVDIPAKRIYVSVPCEFTEAVQTDKVLSFQSSQRISPRHIQTLITNSKPVAQADETFIRCGALFYVLSDKRRLVNPLGMVSDSLRARLCFFKCKTVFLDMVTHALGGFTSVKDIIWLPQNYAEGLYLFEPEKRDGYSILFDLGFISSTFSVVCGNGVAFSEAFSIGIGHIAVLLMEALNIPYAAALELMKKVNLNAKDTHSSVCECTVDGEIYSFQANELRALIKEGLDGICEMIETCLQSFTPKDLTGAPIYITGEGVNVIRGTIEHFSSRLVTPVEVTAPKLPYYDKPQFSSLFSLLNAALSGDKV
ncbi:MAG: hypothetical protein K2N50_02435 [Clostridia bacterium]|nr:hypothetical protein [Clostridia bacterium]